MKITLANNPRTTTSSAISRASSSARSNMNRLDRSALNDLEQIYRAAAADIRNTIESFAGIDGNLRLNNLQDIQNQVNNILGQITDNRDALLNNNLEQAAVLGTQPYTGAVDGSTLVRVADDAVKFTHSFMGKDGLQLSDRLWRIDNHAREVVGGAIQSSIIQGHSASQATNNLLNNGAPVPAALRNKIDNANAGTVGRIASRSLLTGTGSPRHNAMRVFRTELNRAHGEAYMMSGEGTEDFGGWRYLLSPRHPEPDICNMHARVNKHGLGAGVYPSRKRTPWPAHPNTLSYVEIVFKDEITANDKAEKINRIDWLKQQPLNIQRGVLGAPQKVAALNRGLLVENEISTPWRILKKRYEKKGIFAADLKLVNPVSTTVTHTDEAVKYVVDNGLSTGNEHLVAFDQATGKELIKKTSHSVNHVSFTLEEVSLIRRGDRSIELIHNHPSSSSLSYPDLKMASHPGSAVITAAGHDGSVFSARVSSNFQTMSNIEPYINKDVTDTLWSRINTGAITREQANTIHSHVQNVVVERLGHMDYEATFNNGIVGRTLNDIGDDIMQSIYTDVETLFVEKL